ncbi:hypothetical protein XYCOK13_14240 [Xylanibacillus composti]|uniref:Ribosomal protein eL8/eL30/eS12/Gadd45 domain-containing protein n=1 Tax=Xylanibacillus composti TaxID=1572762 RepID=A0A8J4M1Z8_9BACL|nr:hypothetical protein XYCOK13_14240 [Xylanibacillus composti]
MQAVGLAMRAGALALGEEGVMKAVRSGKAKLVLLASDASANTAKKAEDKCRYYEVPIVRSFSREQLGAGTGKGERVLLAVTDDGLAGLIRRHLENSAEVTGIEQTRKQR